MKPLLLTLAILVGFITSKAQTITSTAMVDQHISCHGSKDGYIQIVGYANSSSPNSNFIYTLVGTDTVSTNPSGTFNHLAAGSYTVCAYLNEDSSCHILTVLEPDPLTLSFTTENPVTCGQNDGVISLEIGGGTTVLQPYVTTWTGLAGNMINNPSEYFSMYEDNLSYDTYKVVVEDDNGCFTEGIYSILKQGDINGDGNVDLIDLSAMEQLVSVFGYYYRADIIKDGNIDLLDMTTLEDIIVNLNCN